MAYEYLKSSISLSGGRTNSPKEAYVELFQRTLDESFYNASNWWTIEAETDIGSETYVETDVRITHVINAETGLKLGDDWKTVLFKDVNEEFGIGKRYRFDNSTWLTVNVERTKNLTGTCTVRRCNNSLRWIDNPTGSYYDEPCAIEYVVKEPRDYSTQGSPFRTPGGFLHIHVQLNDKTSTINENQRFLFGNQNHWTAYRVIGTGINDFRNIDTFDNNSSNLLILDLVADFVNVELDDIVNGIAEVNTNVYTIELNKSTAEGDVSDTIQLSSVVTYNGNIVTDREVEWTSDDERIATVNSSGLVTLVKIGTCTITGQIKDNPVYATCGITVTATPSDNLEVRIDPEKNYILEGSTETYSVYLYTNDVQQADTFTITCNGRDVPSTSYVFTEIDGNSFSVQNVLRDSESYLTINMVSGVNSKAFDIRLAGAW